MESKERRFSLQVSRNEQIDRYLLADTTILTSVQGMYQKKIAYYSTNRANRNIQVNELLVDDWYNLYDLCTKCVSNWNLHARANWYA